MNPLCSLGCGLALFFIQGTALATQSVFVDSPDLPGSAWEVNNSVTVAEKPVPRLVADNLKNTQPWFTIATVPEGALEPNSLYEVEVAYEDFQLGSPGAFAYILARSPAYGPSADEMRRWQPTEGPAGRITIQLPTPNAPSVTLNLALHGPASITITGVRVRKLPVPVHPPITVDTAHPNDAVIAKPPSEFTIDQPTPEQPREAGVWEVLPGEKPREVIDQKTLQRAIDSCVAAGVTTLKLPTADYRMDAEEPLRIQGLSDFTLDGNGVTLVFFGGLMAEERYGISIVGNTRLAVRNLKIDWDQTNAPLASLARLVEMKDVGRELVFELLDPAHRQIKVDALHVGAINPVDEEDRAFTRGWATSATPSKVRRDDKGRLVVRYAQPLQLTAGRLYLLRHYVYQRHAMRMSDNAHLTLDDVHVLGFPGIGIVVAGRQHHWQLLRCRIAPEEGKAGLISTTADGLHVMQSQGYMKIEDSVFLRMGDDAINLHDNVSLGLDRIDARTIEALDTAQWRNPFAEGDSIAFLNGSFAPLGVEGVVADVEYQTSGRARLRFESEISDLPANSILINRTYRSDHYIIRNCEFGWMKARGVVLRNGKGLVENCTFHRTDTAAIKIHIDIEGRWAEGLGGQDITIRNNQFRGVNLSAWHGGTAIVIDAVLPAGRPTRAPFRRITIDGNIFSGLTGPALVSYAGEDVVIRNNRVDAIEQPDQRRGYFTSGAAIIKD